MPNTTTTITKVPLSRFLAKTLRVNKRAMKKFLKNLSFGVDVKLLNMSDEKLILTEGL